MMNVMDEKRNSSEYKRAVLSASDRGKYMMTDGSQPGPAGYPHNAWQGLEPCAKWTRRCYLG